MAPSKAWMDLVDDRISDECLDGNTSKKDTYLAGVKKFLDYAFSRTGGDVEIKCPCVRCCNTYSRSREVVYSHLKIYIHASTRMDIDFALKVLIEIGAHRIVGWLLFQKKIWMVTM